MPGREEPEPTALLAAFRTRELRGALPVVAAGVAANLTVLLPTATTVAGARFAMATAAAPWRVTRSAERLGFGGDRRLSVGAERGTAAEWYFTASLVNLGAATTTGVHMCAGSVYALTGSS